jgi:hypothetical protein
VGVLLGASEGQGGKVDGAQVGKGIVGITVGGDVGVVDGGMVCAVVLGAMEGDSLDGIGVGLQSLTAVFQFSQIKKRHRAPQQALSAYV